MTTDTFCIETPDQLRAVADPLRQRLLQALAEPRTLKDAAERMGEPLSRLYHHLDLLLAAGLVKVAAERRVRGAVERTLVVTARRLVVGPSALQQEESAPDRRARLAQDATAGLLASADQAEGALSLLRVSGRFTPEGLDRLQRGLDQAASELSTPGAPLYEALVLIVRRA